MALLLVLQLRMRRPAPAQPPLAVLIRSRLSSRVAKFDLAPVRRLICRSAELGHHRSDIAHEQLDDGIRPGVASVLGREQPCPASSDRHERGPAWLDAMLPLLGEPQAHAPADRIGSVRNAEDRDDLFGHAGMVPQRRAGRDEADGRSRRPGRSRTGLEAATSSVSVRGSYLAGRDILAMDGGDDKPRRVVVWHRCCHFCCHRPSRMLTRERAGLHPLNRRAGFSIPLEHVLNLLGPENVRLLESVAEAAGLVVKSSSGLPPVAAAR